MPGKTASATDGSRRDFLRAAAAAFAAEVGEGRGQMLPGGIDAGWEVSPETLAGA
jgi:hypothetical protein